MPVLSFLIVWTGYSLLAYGVATVRGCNVTFSQVAIPGRYQGCNADSGSQAGTNPNAPSPPGTSAVPGKTVAGKPLGGSKKGEPGYGQPPGEVGPPPGYTGRA